jgi:hypothetical protein
MNIHVGMSITKNKKLFLRNCNKKDDIRYYVAHASEFSTMRHSHIYLYEQAGLQKEHLCTVPHGP